MEEFSCNNILFGFQSGNSPIPLLLLQMSEYPTAIIGFGWKLNFLFTKLSSVFSSDENKLILSPHQHSTLLNSRTSGDFALFYREE